MAQRSGSGASRSVPPNEGSQACEAPNGQRFPWQVFASELVGTALLVWVGLSLVILISGEGSPIKSVLPSEGWRRLVTGFLFGTTGALIVLSPVGMRSGAHINPVVTIAFRLMDKVDLRTTLGYLIAQLSGAILGALPLFAWGSMAKSVAFGATLSGPGFTLSTVLLGEVITTFMMVALLCVFLGFRKLRPFTPAIFPPLYAIMVWLRRRSQAQAPTLPAAWDRQSFRDNGRVGGSTGSALCSGVSPHVSSVVFSRSESR